MLVTVDASVFVASFRKEEASHRACRALIEALHAGRIPMIEPSVLTVEIAAALSRTGTRRETALSFAEAVALLPGMTALPLDAGEARHAADIAVRHRLRAVDAQYVAVASRYGAILVSLDGEQIRRAPDHVCACRPEAAIKRLPSGA